MDDISYDPRTWALAEANAGPGDARADEPAAFPLASAAALKLWLASALVLGIASVGAWSMRAKADAPAVPFVSDAAPTSSP